jgi:hypothetical protein
MQMQRRTPISHAEKEGAMRAFFAALVVAAIVTGAAYAALTSIQESIASANISSSTRLDKQERVTLYGREG